ncbi:MAG: permease [Phycisphaerae bacterium]|nr:permease [Phycisphaerae bacterium]
MEFLTGLVFDFWATLSEMAPYLLLGFLVAGLLSVCISPNAIERHLGKRGFWSIFKASTFGIPLPLCSCGVIPLSMSLHKHGASKGATTSFLLATPQTNVYSFLVTYSLLGPVMAIFRPLAALTTGLLGGGLAEIFDKAPSASVEQTESQNPVGSPPQRHWLIRALRHGFVVLPTDIGRSMLAGLVIAALMSAVLPDDFFASYLAGGGGLVAMLVMLVVGIPIYACSTASVPVAVQMIAKGLSPGAAMVFLIAGPTANAASLSTLWSTLGKRSTAAYLISIAVCSLATGFIIDQFVFAGGYNPDHLSHGETLPMGLSSVMTTGMLAVLGFGIFRKYTQTKAKKQAAPTA